MTRILFKVLGLAVVLAGGASCGTDPEPTQPPATTTPAPTPADAGTGPDPAQISRGEALFLQHCEVCHPGGQQGVGPSLITLSATADQIRSQVRNGLGVMPPFPPTLITDAQLTNLVAYVMSLRSL